MQSNHNFAALCGATVLSLSLMACNGEDPLTKPDNNSGRFELREPKIVSPDGREVKYQEVNISTDHRFSIDDRLVFDDSPAALENTRLLVRTSCARGEERLQLEQKIDLRRDHKLLEFIPEALLYSKNMRPLKNTVCALEIAALKGSSRHNFPALNLIMSEESINDLILIRAMRPIEEGQRIPFNDLGGVRLPEISQEETLKLQCNVLAATSGNYRAFTLLDLDSKNTLTGAERKPEVCRVLKLRGKSVQSVSPFFKIQFLQANVVGEIDNTVVVQGRQGPTLAEKISFRRQKITNPTSEPILFKLPSQITMTGTVTAAGWTAPFSAPITIHADSNVIVRHTGDSIIIKANPAETIQLGYVLGAVICGHQDVKKVTLKAPVDQIELAAIDSDEEVLATWYLNTQNFNIYGGGSDGHSKPFGCTVR